MIFTNERKNVFFLEKSVINISSRDKQVVTGKETTGFRMFFSFHVKDGCFMELNTYIK
jgi:hypothetical protein